MLTEKQKNFCEVYLANGYNALQAYCTAFNKDPKTLKNKPSYPYTLLREPQIKEYISKRREEIYESLNIDSIRIIEEIADIAFSSKEQNKEDYNVNAKLKALDLLSKNLGLQTQKAETKETIEVTLEDDDDGV